MHIGLAYAETPDSGAVNLAKVLGGLGILVVTALLIAVIVGISRARKHRQADAILVAALFWGVLAAGSMMYAAATQLNWSKEYTTRIESGYYDPRDSSDKPTLPIALWTGLGVAYAAMLGWAAYRQQAD
jgi:hypothetical protein